MPSGLPEEECLACAGRTFHFTGACAALIFDQAAQKMIHELKYHHRRSVGRFLGALLGKKIVRESLCPHISCIVPMPIHPVRRRERGFNQAEVIAEGVSSVTGWPVQNGLIKRTRWRSSQTALTTEERTRNVKSVFGIAETAVLEGMRVALVDDVFTTGATLDSCAKTLLDAGASVVYAFTVARA
jgi:ComF family protein